MRINNQCLLFFLLFAFVPGAQANLLDSSGVFGYQQDERSNLDLFPQWLSVIERHIVESAPAGDCQETQFNQCHLKRWYELVDSLKGLPETEQVRRINDHANEHAYVLDIDNYGIDDYWATPLQFLQNDGDCEDYAIIKLLSFKRLGYDMNRMRVVVVQDTNLRVAHAVMALDTGDDVMILDNQIQEVISHTDVFHYIPVYSVNEKAWWMHTPNF